MAAPDFSLPRDPFSPIRPHKVEQLFSPRSSKKRSVNDMTYRVPANQPLPQAKPDNLIEVDESNWCLPSFSSRFPRQSTGIKKPPNVETKENTQKPDITVALPNTTRFDDVINQSTTEESDVDDGIPEYRALYRLKDVQPIRATCFHPYGDVFIFGTNSRKLLIYPYPYNNEYDNAPDFHEYEVPQPKHLFQADDYHRGSIYCTAFNDNGNLLATGSNDQTVHILRYDPEKQQPSGDENVLTMHTGTVRDVQFLGTTHLLSAGAGDFGIYVTDSDHMRRAQVFPGHTDAVMSLHTWDDPNLFASGSLDGTIRLWDIRAARCVQVAATNKPGGDGAPTGGPCGAVRVEHNGKLLVSGHEDGRCMLYDIRGGRVLQIFKAHDNEIRAMNFSPKTYYLLTGSYDKTIKLTDLQGELSQKLPTVEIATQADKVIQAAWHPTEYNFTSTCADGTATLWTIPKSVPTTND